MGGPCGNLLFEQMLSRTSAVPQGSEGDDVKRILGAQLSPYSVSAFSIELG